MKKYIAVLLLALSLTGCRNRYDDNSTQNDMNNIGEDVRDGVNNIGEDLQDGVNDIGEDINDGVNDMRDQYDNATDDSTNGATSGPYGYNIPNQSLWSIPSFCNAIMGSVYYRLY